MPDIYICGLPESGGERSPSWSGLERLAGSQAGYFTTAQAKRLGFSSQLLAHHLESRALLRPHRGIYRLASAAAHPFEPLMPAWLWSAGDGTFSHATALHLHGLIDAPPLFIQLTVPPTWRTRQLRRPPRIALHFAAVELAEREERNGIPVTTAARALRDASQSLRDRRLLHGALRRALDRDLIDFRSADEWFGRFRA